MKIQAAIAAPQGGDFVIREVELDEPRADEILVKISAVGLCHTDVVAQQGGFGFGIPAVLGHEGAGVVVKTGANVTKVATGDRVAISFRACGVCPNCASRHPAYCHTMPLLNYTGARPDGTRSLRCEGEDLASNFFGQSSFASHALTYESNVVKLPDDFPFELAAPLGCGIQTGAGSILNVFKCEKGSALVVSGGGTVGLSAVMAGAIAGCAAIIVVEPFAARRALAMELGATHVLDPRETEDLTAAIRAVVPMGVNYAFDTTGRTEVMDALMKALAPLGSLGCVGIPPPGTPMPGDLGNAMTLGHRVIGIIEGDSIPDEFIPALIGYYRAGKLPLDRLVKRYKFTDINQAVADQHAGKCLKAVLSFA